MTLSGEECEIEGRGEDGEREGREEEVCKEGEGLRNWGVGRRVRGEREGKREGEGAGEECVRRREGATGRRGGGGSLKG